LAAAILFAIFIAGKGIPTLRHDWNWPIDRSAIPSFTAQSLDGWLSIGFGTPNPHPTTYLVGPLMGGLMWLAGPLGALGLVAAVIGYLCMRGVDAVAMRCGSGAPAAIGLGLFALFNPWVYNEIVAGHVMMVLAYGALIGLLAEMMRGRDASALRLALWIVLIQAQLQLFIVALAALVPFGWVTRKWTPLIAGAVVVLPSLVGLIAERATLLQIPYGVTWQTDQSVSPPALLGLGGYFAGYADRLGWGATAAVWIVVGLALAGVVAARRTQAATWTASAAIVLFVVVTGIHGPLALPYSWVVANVPESGVFRELYDLAGVIAALLTLLACAAAARLRVLGYVALAAGITLAVTWLLQPPAALWVASGSYPRPTVAAPPNTKVAFLPAFQPLGLRAGRGDGADPDLQFYPNGIAPVNEYLPSYPVDMALARYEQTGDAQPLQALGVGEIVNRPWLVSLTRGTIGFAAASLAPASSRFAPPSDRYVANPAPLVSDCAAAPVVAFVARIGQCNLFFGDAPGYSAVAPIVASSDSIDSRVAWIDARLAYAEAPWLAQGIGGALTQSTVPHRVDPGRWLLAYVRGELRAPSGSVLLRNGGGFSWVRVPQSVESVQCSGLCELVAQATRIPSVPNNPPPRARPLEFTQVGSWLYVVRREPDAAQLLRLNERYDPSWIAFASGRILPHVRVDMSANGWFLGDATGNVILLEATALAQLIAEMFGFLCAIWLVQALLRAPTKRAPGDRPDARSIR